MDFQVPLFLSHQQVMELEAILVIQEMLAEHLFSTLLSACVSVCTFVLSQCRLTCDHVFMAQDSEARKRVPSVIHMLHRIMLSCLFWAARALH